MSLPLVSLVVPVYNVEKYLATCLDSLLLQTLQDIEIICVNDGSTDESPHILDEYTRRDGRIQVIHQKNQGVSTARNAGLAIARAPYISFIDSDDWADQTLYEQAFQEIEKDPTLDFICWGCTGWEKKGDIWVIDKKETPFNHKKFNNLIGKHALTDALKCALLGPVWDKLFRTEKIKHHDICFPETIGLHEDTVFMCKYLAWAQKVFIMNSNGYNHRYAPDSILDKASKNRKKVDSVFIPMFNNIYDYYSRFELAEKQKHLLAEILVIVLRHALRFSSDYNAFLAEARQFVKQYDLPDTETHTVRDLIAEKSFVRFYPLSPLEKIFSLTNAGDKKVIRILGIEFPVDKGRKKG